MSEKAMWRDLIADLAMMPEQDSALFDLEDPGTLEYNVQFARNTLKFSSAGEKVGALLGFIPGVKNTILIGKTALVFSLLNKAGNVTGYIVYAGQENFQIVLPYE